MKRIFLSVFVKTMMVSYCFAFAANGKPSLTNLTDSGAVYGNPNYRTTTGLPVQEFIQLTDAEAEPLRRGTPLRWTDFEPTGFYLPANTQLKLTVDKLKGAALPQLLVGTVSLHKGVAIKTVPLSEGVNLIPANTIGGILWIRFTTIALPDSKVRITFNSGHQRMPVFIKNKTTAAQWNAQLDSCQTPEVLVVGDRVYNVYTRERALKYRTEGQDPNIVITGHDNFWNWENEFIGLDNSKPVHAIPVHNRILVTELLPSGGKGGAQNASDYRVGVNYPAPKNKVFTSNSLTMAGWGLWHEMGHIHNMLWRWSGLGEVTTNLPAHYVRENLKLPSRFETRWPLVKEYLSGTAKDKNFNKTKGGIKEVMFYQLRLAFGWDFYKEINKKYREKKPENKEDNAMKMRWFMLESCKVSGKNLTAFFKKWGFSTQEVPQSVYDEIAALGLPNPSVDPSTLID